MPAHPPPEQQDGIIMFENILNEEQLHAESHPSAGGWNPMFAARPLPFR
jgi:hypothetical protein